jgi:hypothetical protein
MQTHPNLLWTITVRTMLNMSIAVDFLWLVDYDAHYCGQQIPNKQDRL